LACSWATAAAWRAHSRKQRRWCTWTCECCRCGPARKQTGWGGGRAGNCVMTITRTAGCTTNTKAPRPSGIDSLSAPKRDPAPPVPRVDRTGAR
jgi:hypothetical protein